MAVQYEKDNGWSSGWIDIFKKNVVETSGEIDGLFSKITSGADSIKNYNGFDDMFNAYNITTHKEDLEEFFTTIYKSGDVAKEYEKHMIQSGKATTQFAGFTKKAGNALKSFGAAMASMAATWAISEILGYLFTIEQRAEEARQEMISLGEETAETNKQLSDLISQYEELGEDGKIDTGEMENARGIQEQIVELVGDHYEGINLANGAYDEQIKRLKEIQALEANNSYADLYDAKESAEEELYNKATGGWWGNNYLRGGAYQTDEETEAIENLLKKHGLGKYIQDTGEYFYINPYYHSPEHITQAYKDMEYLRNIMTSKAYKDEMSDGGVFEDFYNELTTRSKDLKSAVDKFQIANENFNLNEAVRIFNNVADYDGAKVADSYGLKNGSLIKSKEDFDAYIKSVEDSTSLNEDLKNSIIELANSQFPDYCEKVEETGNIIDDTSNEMTVSLETLKTASESVATLQKAFKELSEDGYITVDTLAEIQKATGLTGTAWEEYELKLLNAKAGSDEFKQVMTDLTYKMIEEKVKLDGITSATEDEIRATENKIAAILRENNVLNANEIAHEAVERAKAKEIIKTKLAEGVTESNIEALIKEATQCDITADAFIYLTAQEILFGNNSLSVDQKLTALKNLATQIRSTSAEYAMLNSLLETPYGKSGQEQKEWAKKHGFTVEAKKDESGNFIKKNGHQDWVWTDADGNTYENANEAALAAALKGFADVLKYENPLSPLYDLTDKTPDKPEKVETTPKEHKRDNSYSDFFDEILADRQKAREAFEEKDEQLQKELEQALEDLDLESAERIAQAIADNETEYQRVLGEHLEQSQNALNNEILPAIFEIAPELKGKTWEDITEVDKEKIRQGLEQAKLDAENAIIDEENRLQTELDALETQWNQDSYNMKSKNDNKEDEVYKQKEAEFKSKKDTLEKALDAVTASDSPLQQALETVERQKEAWDGLTASAEDYAEDIKEIPGLIDESQERIEQSSEDLKGGLDDVFAEYERHIDRQTDELQKQADAYDILINKAQAKADAEQSMYDSLRNVRDIQRDISKELATNKALGEYLDEDTRKLLFNEDDYSTLSKKLSGISADIAGLGSWYESQINSLTEDNWYLEDAITAEYERRLAMKEKEYEIARAELDLEKKKQELNNILNEKNIRMLTKDAQGNYKWTQIHNVEEASRVAGEIAELEGQIAETRLQATEDSIVNQKQAEADALNAEKAAIEKRIELINEETEELAKAVEDITNPLMDFGNLVSMLNQKLGSIIGVVSVIGGSYSKSGGYGSGSSSGGLYGGGTQEDLMAKQEESYNKAVTALNLYLDGNGDVMDSKAKKLKEEVDKWETRLNRWNTSRDKPKSPSNFARPTFAFDQGGVAKGKGLMFKDTNYDELVLDPVQTDYFKNFVENTKGFDILAGYMSNLIKVNQVPFKDVSHGGVTQFNGDIILPNVREPEDFMYELKKNLQHYNF